MATRVNRAAKAATKTGGRSRRRNKSIRMFDTSRSIDHPKNQEAFRIHGHESRARMHNFSSGILTEDEAPGVPEGTGFTPKHTSSKETLIHSRSPDFRLYSPVFGRHSEFPVRNTQEGENLSPNLIWVGHKQQAVEEFVLVLEDMDSGTGQQPFVHWLMYRIPANVSELPEGVVPRAGVAEVNGALHGLNSYGLLGYRGPMPPVGDGWHRYRFRLLALEAPIHDIRPGLTWPEVYDKIREHIIEVTDCMVRYQRQREYRATG